ncbi:hypothetical protein AB834_02500 [PVC group bacterium (ex Bugula neritina AB1)]|nr:hypothetical protein AB834_02500 [PVC group bacterium (ex Bugula neritina AB1)]
MFEGSEKKLEIILTPLSESIRKDTALNWSSLLKVCGAKIISLNHHKHMDSYILSESSLFVYDDRVILITCGSTKLYLLAPLLIKHFGIEKISYIFYARKKLLFPEKQLSDFEKEIEYINKVLPGNSYRLGPTQGEHLHVFIATSYESPDYTLEDDFTIELLMSQPSSSIINDFEKNASNSKAIQNKLAFESFFDNIFIEDHIFEPRGYSLNGISQEFYLTLHVTPQEENSYVSFETNFRSNHILKMLNYLIKLFSPESILIALYSNFFNLSHDLHIPGYEKKEKTKVSFKDYDIENFHLTKKEGAYV